MVEITKYPQFTLIGTIIDIDKSNNIGYVQSEDGIKRFFLLSDMPKYPTPAKGRKITFTHVYHTNGPKADKPKIILPILSGVITAIDIKSGTGYILGEDGISRFFLLSDTKQEEKFKVDCKVYFQHFSDEEGPKAQVVKIIPKGNLIGIINFYDLEKCFGFICGYDGQSYYFHKLDFNNIDLSIEVGTMLMFKPKLTKKGLQAKNCHILSSLESVAYKENMRYSLPEEFKTSKLDYVRGYCTIKKEECLIYASSEISFEEAEKLLIKRAKQVGANALFNVKFYKENNNYGNYIYKTFSCHGQIAFIAKPNPKGKVIQEYMKIINMQNSINKNRDLTWKFMALFIFLISISLLINEKPIGVAMLLGALFLWPQKAWLRKIK